MLLAHAGALAERPGFEAETVTDEIPAGRFDVAVATSLATAERAFRTDAGRRALLVHDLEDRRYAPGTPERALARLALDLPVAFVATRRHVAETLARLRPDAPCHVVRFGVSTPLAVGEPTGAAGDELRVHAPDAPAAAIVASAPGTRAVATIAEADVVLLLEPSPDPTAPLPAFHAGATCVAAEAAGAEEIVEHGVNGLLCEPDDTRGPARHLELLARDRALLRRLRDGALATARGWPSVEDAAAELATALAAIASDEAPDPAPAAAAMLADLRGTLEEHRAVLAERDALARRLEPIERVAANPVVRRVLARRRGR